MKIYQAIQDGDLEVLQELILVHDVNEQHYGKVPLFTAVESDNVEALRLLIQAGADVHVKVGKYPEDVLLSYASDECAWELIQAGAPTSYNVTIYPVDYLHYAIDYGREMCFDRLLEQGVSVNATNLDGNAALQVAVLDLFDNVHKISMIAKLLEVGADVNIKGQSGDTALMWTTIPRDGIVFKMLLNAGADINIGNDKGETVLMRAIQNRNFEACQILLEAGADPFAQNNDGISINEVVRRARQSINDEWYNYKELIERTERIIILIKQAQAKWIHVQDRVMVLHSMSNSLLGDFLNEIDSSVFLQGRYSTEQIQRLKMVNYLNKLPEHLKRAIILFI